MLTNTLYQQCAASYRKIEALIIMKQQQKKMNQNLLQTFRKFLEKAGTIMVHERSRKNWLIAGNRYQDAGLDGS